MTNCKLIKRKVKFLT